MHDSPNTIKAIKHKKLGISWDSVQCFFKKSEKTGEMEDNRGRPKNDLEPYLRIMTKKCSKDRQQTSETDLAFQLVHLMFRSGLTGRV